ncbi:XRE family transcriptional regulator [Avibacterium avium]|uniref:XRE family transcriptional regulator n=1 Tax=Avibacterium avium TaxID=751 RepID=UPI003BF820B1
MLHSKGKMLHKITINEIVLAQKLSIALRQEMHAQHWTGKMVATALEISERTVRDWLSGNRLPNGRDLVALMTISPHIRQVIWEESQSEKYYLDTQMIRIILWYLLINYLT